MTKLSAYSGHWINGKQECKNLCGVNGSAGVRRRRKEEGDEEKRRGRLGKCCRVEGGQ